MTFYGSLGGRTMWGFFWGRVSIVRDVVTRSVELHFWRRVQGRMLCVLSVVIHISPWRSATDEF